MFTIVFLITGLIEAILYYGYRWLSITQNFIPYELMTFVFIFSNLVLIVAIITYMSIKNYRLHSYSTVTGRGLTVNALDNAVKETHEKDRENNENGVFWGEEVTVQVVKKEKNMKPVAALLAVVIANLIGLVVYLVL